MPEPTKDSLASASSTNWLDNAPGGDIPFDQLFGTEPEASFSSANPTGPAATTSPTATTPTEPAPTTEGFKEIRTATGSVYKAYDDVIKGIEEKDTLIQQLRDKFKTLTGNDPLKPQPEPVQQPGYLNDPTRFANDLADAAKSGDAKKYRDTLVGLMEEYFGPARPLITDFARSRATQQVSDEYKDFQQFVGSEDFNKTLQRNPALAQAIKVSSENLAYQSQLPELYRLAYESHTARRLPEIVQAAKQTPVVPTQNVRPSVQNTSLTPGAPVTQRDDSEMLKTSEGRKELLARFRAQGIEDFRW